METNTISFNVSKTINIGNFEAIKINYGQSITVDPTKPVETQRENAGVDFVASMVRFRGGQWRIVLTPEQFNTLLQAALS